MAYLDASTRYVFHGVDASGEIWATGFWTQANATGGVEQLQINLAEVLTVWSATAKDVWRSLIQASSKYAGITAYAYDSTHSTAIHVADVAVLAADGIGTGGGLLPLQVCMVNSLRTAVSGRANRGRMYLPAHGADLTNHLFTSAKCDAVADATRDFFEAVNDSSILGTAAVFSKTYSHANDVDRVIVDNRPDIQRRRANQQAITYQASVPVSVV